MNVLPSKHQLPLDKCLENVFRYLQTIYLQPFLLDLSKNIYFMGEKNGNGGDTEVSFQKVLAGRKRPFLFL